MKKEITAYITGVINSYTKTIAILNENKVFNLSLNSFVAIKDEFSDLLEIVIDMPEENKEVSILAFNVALENGDLKRRITELEESCETMNEVEINLHKKIEELEGSNYIWKIAFDVLKGQLIKAGGNK